eukprot:TRINITY_DN4366_c0_g1_i4.p2 TRINITY_DN4366_c0_g1~~TRINITY_DN4366_c0_g1_i4.p2  ORF type:complete len:405 (+),score=161.97 TRINITY_DN4366_c0_g1_i4:734-1948(+)
MESRKRSREEGLEDIVLNECDAAKTWQCEKAMLVGQTPQVYVFMHPLKASYMHFVIVPKEQPTPASRGKIVKFLEGAAKDVIAHYTKAADCRKFLFTHKGKFRKDKRVGSTSRWTGPKEIEEMVKHWGANTDVQYTYGFEAFDPVVHDLHLHVMSKDFVYLTDAGDWNLLTTEWGLIPPSALAMMYESDVKVAFPGPEQMNDKLTETDLRCYVTGKVCSSLDEARRCSFEALTGRNEQKEEKEEKGSTPFSDSEEEDLGPMRSVSEQRESSVATIATHTLPAPTGAASLLNKPKRPNVKVKDIGESILSAFQKWCDYLFHLKYLQTDAEEQEYATKQMKELAARKVLKNTDIINMNEIQVRIRNKYFGAPQGDKDKRKARWNGHDFEITDKEIEPEIDKDRVPY